MLTYTNFAPTHYYVYMFVVDGTPRYIGKGIGSRMHQHEKEARSGKRTMWLNYLRASIRNDRDINVEVVQDNLTNEAALALEVSLIAHYGRKRLETGPLMNFAAGGEGHDSETATALFNRPDVKEKIRRGRKTWHAVPENKAAHSARMQLMHQDPVNKQRHVEAVRANAKRPEYKAKISASSLATHSDPEFKERHRAAVTTATNAPEYRNGQKQRTAASWQDPEIRSRRLTAHATAMQSDEYRTKQSARMKEVLANPEVHARVADAARRTLANPEVREKIGQGVSASYDKPGKREATRKIRAEVSARPEVKAAKSLAAKLRKEAADYFGLHYYNASKEVVQSYLQLSRRFT